MNLASEFRLRRCVTLSTSKDILGVRIILKRPLMTVALTSEQTCKVQLSKVPMQVDVLTLPTQRLSVEAEPPTPFGQPLLPAPERLRRKSKKTYRTRLIKAGIEPRCYGGPGDEGPLSDDAIIACLHGLADECMGLFITL